MKKMNLHMVAIGLLLAMPVVSHGAIKCWTNKDGVRECGDSVPPEYAQQSSKTLNDRGITVKTRERALTREELAEKQKREAEEKRLAKEAAEQRREQNAADRVLLSTFLTEEEIISARDRKLTVIDGNIEITHIGIGKLKNDLQEKRKKAASYERKGEQVPKGVLSEIASLERQIANKEEFIQAKKTEKETITEQYDRDLKRFRELKEQGKKLR